MLIRHVYMLQNDCHPSLWQRRRPVPGLPSFRRRERARPAPSAAHAPGKQRHRPRHQLCPRRSPGLARLRAGVRAPRAVFPRPGDRGSEAGSPEPTYKGPLPPFFAFCRIFFARAGGRGRGRSGLPAEGEPVRGSIPASRIATRAEGGGSADRAAPAPLTPELSVPGRWTPC